MAANISKPKLIAVVGPTASGKSDLAMKISKQFNGEIITADSRTIYKSMDIGTAKPTAEDQSTVPHWGVDLIEPGEVFSAHKFKEYAGKRIKDIQSRGRLPILVGGTGLYVDSVLFDYDFVDSDTSQREKLGNLAAEELQDLTREKGYKMPENYQNKRHLIRTLEREGRVGSKKQIRDDVVLVGLILPDEVLKNRINNRAEQYFKDGLLDETTELLKGYGEDKLKKTHGIAYIAALSLLKKEITQIEAVELIKKQEWQYARRQRTWFRRNKLIHWHASPEEAFISVSKALNN